jgi:hypothetical protein
MMIKEQILKLTNQYYNETLIIKTDKMANFVLIYIFVMYISNKLFKYLIKEPS